MLRNHEPNNNLQSSQVVVWGPPHSGKHWFISAFSKELDFLNRRDPDFHYELNTLDPGLLEIPLIRDEPVSQPAQHTGDELFTFRRLSSKTDQAHRISAQSHRIVIPNNDNEQLANDFRIQDNPFLNTQNQVLLVDISRNTSSYQENPFLPEIGENIANPLEVEGWTATEYYRFFQEYFRSIGTQKKNIALCITKGDKYPYKGDPQTIFQRQFGELIYKFVENQMKSHRIEFFFTSSAGFIYQGNQVIANIYNSELIDKTRWSPINVAAPFFWIFEIIERNRLWTNSPLFRRGYMRDYIPYPIKNRP